MSGDDDWRLRYENVINHPWVKVEREWKSLDLVAQILEANQQDLLDLIHAFETSVEIALEWVNNVKNPNPTKDAFRLHFVRYLFNYLSSVTTLVDHTRKLMTRYEGSEVHAEYLAKVRAISNAGRGPLLQRLRNHALHDKIPPWRTEISFRGVVVSPETLDASIHLSRDQMLEYKDLPASARRFLESSAEKIPIAQIVKEYREEVKHVYDWLFGQVPVLHSADIAEYNDLVVAFQGAERTPGHPDYVPPEERSYLNPQ
ncbi:hypothetical protein [Demequina sp. NBRC 110055]|uniref:hypothetical protein n=1 Tax=Demequina sp. NBRC 110055 TaxID=1570344 RepID=UPI000A0200C1|nr:hypothetical protein [Demequina sp. NBRC 110055]